LNILVDPPLANAAGRCTSCFDLSTDLLAHAVTSCKEWREAYHLNARITAISICTRQIVGSLQSYRGIETMPRGQLGPMAQQSKKCQIDNWP
jgi:hypothetical protein